MTKTTTDDELDSGPMTFIDPSGKKVTVMDILAETGRRERVEREDAEVVDITAKIDEIRDNISNFPKSRRSYDELFHLVKSSLNRLHDKRSSGLINTETEGRLGSKYSVALARSVARIPVGWVYHLEVRPRRISKDNPGVLVSKGAGLIKDRLMGGTFYFENKKPVINEGYDNR